MPLGRYCGASSGRVEPACSKAATHLPALDGLRAVAILLVIAVHVAYVSTFLVPQAWIMRIMGSFGHGVQLFFVVSAFTAELTPMFLRSS